MVLSIDIITAHLEYISTLAKLKHIVACVEEMVNNMRPLLYLPTSITINPPDCVTFERQHILHP